MRRGETCGSENRTGKETWLEESSTIIEENSLRAWYVLSQFECVSMWLLENGSVGAESEGIAARLANSARGFGAQSASGWESKAVTTISIANETLFMSRAF